MNRVTVLSFPQIERPLRLAPSLLDAGQPTLPFGIFCQKSGGELLELMETEKCRVRDMNSQSVRDRRLGRRRFD